MPTTYATTILNHVFESRMSHPQVRNVEEHT